MKLINYVSRSIIIIAFGNLDNFRDIELSIIIYSEYEIFAALKYRKASVFGLDGASEEIAEVV